MWLKNYHFFHWTNFLCSMRKCSTYSKTNHKNSNRIQHEMENWMKMKNDAKWRVNMNVISIRKGVTIFASAINHQPSHTKVTKFYIHHKYFHEIKWPIQIMSKHKTIFVCVYVRCAVRFLVVHSAPCVHIVNQLNPFQSFESVEIFRLSKMLIKLYVHYMLIDNE